MISGGGAVKEESGVVPRVQDRKGPVPKSCGHTGVGSTWGFSPQVRWWSERISAAI